jgi:putative SOS response-associated peptidase YedK
MCGRYVITAPVEAMQELFGFEERPNFPPRFNVAPSQDVPIVRRRKEGGGRELALVRWGLIPYWAKDASIGHKLINARAEGIAGKPALREAFRRRRCLVPANGFYEWETRGRSRQPWLIRPKDGGLMAFAGLWEAWRDPGSGERVHSCTIVTTLPNALAGRWHDRMPVILAPEDYERWLDPADADAQALLRPCPEEWLEAYRVSPRVNRPDDDDAELIEPLAPERAAEGLFERG